ncbi:uncharacterized protein G2W53_010298 [Senna tora]|uniref:Uncharacterized protein n=1 Tax=Senna tora TaxID=362788 RepID=A0A835C9H6_9FABA|nr:uncharacterized protein G2W53_010298 [Senna tora]
MLRYDPRPSRAMKIPIGASKPLRPRFVIRDMLRHDPRPSHAMTTPIGASKPLRFTITRGTDMFHSLVEHVFCLIIREDFSDPTAICRSEHVKIRHDPRSFHAMPTPIGASNPLQFANTTRTDVFHTLAQQLCCLVFREEYVKTCSTPLPCQDDSNWSIKITPVRKYNANRRVLLTCATSVLPRKFVKVYEIRPRFVIRNMLRHDPHSSHAMTTPNGSLNPLRFANTTRIDVFYSLAQQVFCIVIREGFSDPTAICCPKYVKTGSTPLPCLDDSNWSIKSTLVSEIRSRFVIRNMLRHDPRTPLSHDNSNWSIKSTLKVLRHDPCPSHAKTTPIGASKLLWFANTTRTDVFHSLAQQVVCLVIRDGF